MVYKIEGEETQPSLDMAIRIARALNVTLSAMLNEEGRVVSRVFHRSDQTEWQDLNTAMTRRSLLPTTVDNEWLQIKLPKYVKTGMLPPLIEKAAYLYVLSGKVTIELSNGESISVESGDVFFIPERLGYNIANKHAKNVSFLY